MGKTDIGLEILGVSLRGHVKPVQRWMSGLYSLDNAFENDKGELGFPIGRIIEWFGPSGHGKTTSVFSLSGRIATHCGGDIAFVDLEDSDPELLARILAYSGFSGQVNFILTEKDETTMDELRSSLHDNSAYYSVGILDAVGAISPQSEKDGDLGDANMGRRGRIMAQFSRGSLFTTRSALEETPKTIFLINHEYPKIGGMGKIQPGGEVKGFSSSLRIHIQRLYRNKKWMKFPDGSYVLHGKVIKNKVGYGDREFYLGILAGKGIHTGFTAVWDAIMLGKVELKNGITKIGSDSFGRMSKIIEKAKDNDEEFFQPFYDVLKGNNEKDK